MDILIFSDSHGHGYEMERALRRQLRRPDLILFLGDGARDLWTADLAGTPTRAVCGNCDLFWGELPFPCPEEDLFTVEEHRILMTHGHRYRVKGGLGALLRRAAEVDAHVVLFGHTHEPLEQTLPAGTQVGNTVLSHPVTLFNPGSIGHGGSFGTLHVTESGVLLSHGTLDTAP